MKKAYLFTIVVVIAAAVITVWLVISNSNAPEGAGSQAQSLPSRPASPELERGEQAGERAPDFALRDYDGKTVRLADFAGKSLVINIWAAWCPFCRKELVDFAAVQKEFGDKAVIIAIDRAESREVAKKYSDALGVTGDLIFLLDPSDSFYQSIGGFSMPETIFIDKNGAIVDHKRGPMDANEIRQKISNIL